MDDIETSVVTLCACDDADTSHIASSSDHGNVARVKGNVSSDLSSLNVKLDGVVDLDEWVRVADCAAVVRDEERNSLLAETDLLDLGELVCALLGSDTVNGKATLGVVDETEVFASLFDRDDIHESGWVGCIGADLAIDLDEPLHEDRLDLLGIESVL